MVLNHGVNFLTGVGEVEQQNPGRRAEFQGVRSGDVSQTGCKEGCVAGCEMVVVARSVDLGWS